MVDNVRIRWLDMRLCSCQWESRACGQFLRRYLMGVYMMVLVRTQKAILWEHTSVACPRMREDHKSYVDATLQALY